MKKVSLLFLIIVSLLATSFAGIGVPHAKAGTITVTPSTLTAGTPAAFSIAFATTATGQTLAVTLQSFTVPVSISSANVSLTVNNTALPSAAFTVATTPASSLITFQTTLSFSGNIIVSFAAAAGITTPASPNSYPVFYSLTPDSGFGIVTVSGPSVSSPYITNVSSSAPAAVASYTLYFLTSATGALTTSDKIYIQFENTIPSTTGYIQVNSSVVNAIGTLAGYIVTVSVPSAIGGSTFVQVTLPAALGIANPSAIGSYRLKVWTTRDTTAVWSTNSYSVTGTSVTGLSLTVDPKAQSAQVQVQASFQTSASGALQQNSGTIVFDFPSNMTVPSSINRSLVTVNGTQAHDVNVLANGVVSIVTPVTIAAYSSVTVVFAGTSGIYNPSTSGTTVTIAVSTSADLAAVSSSYTTVTSQVTQPQVQLTSNGAGSTAGYTISFNTGAVGSLRANYDTITIMFPSGTIVPTAISRDLVKVNNYPVYTVGVSGNRLNIVAAVNASASTPIQVVIDKTANIKNPSVAGSFTLQVYTSVEVTPVTSAIYAISNLPRTLILVSPANADGLAGFYRTRPTVVLTATSSIDPAPVVYYSINGGAQQIYAAPFQLPDGNVALTYYARDRQGNQEDAQTFTAKVDATAPVITITLPAEGAVTGQATIGIQGKTEAGATLTVAGAAVPVSAQGDFLTQVALKDGLQAIVFAATDVAGNIGQAQLHVTLDTTPPVLTITKPVMYSTVVTGVCEVAGKTEPGATVKVGGSPVTVNADGTFSMNVMLKEGDNLIEITATDTVGNQRKTAIPVTFKARTAIHLQIGNKTALVNDVKKTLQAAPVNVKGTTMVPLRFVGEAFGATVTWDPVFQIIDIELKGSTVRLQIGTNFASVAGKKVILQSVPVIIKGTTMVPIRFISEAFGAKVVWTAATQGIDITYPKP